MKLTIGDESLEPMCQIKPAIRELDGEYQTSLQAVQAWLRQRGVKLEIGQVKTDVEIVRSLIPEGECTRSEQ